MYVPQLKISAFDRTGIIAGGSENAMDLKSQ